MKNYLYNTFTSIKQGQLVKRDFVIMKRKKICEAFLDVLWREGFILGYKIESNKKHQVLKVFLKYSNGKPSINSIYLVSKPSRRIYYSVKQMWKLDSSKSFIIVSTNKGLKSIVECKKLKAGGEPYLAVN